MDRSERIVRKALSAGKTADEAADMAAIVAFVDQQLFCPQTKRRLTDADTVVITISSTDTGRRWNLALSSEAFESDQTQQALAAARARRSMSVEICDGRTLFTTPAREQRCD
ncbi:hypothetical protein [Glycomyces arizonensis]|uniref:hypothetical protein n=1 Tax=Glycomyces arizonensis TaxID=256035 RepID=UPI00040F5E87|nr:hypothetical protein [Glycomyces arizonensis]